MGGEVMTRRARVPDEIRMGGETLTYGAGMGMVLELSDCVIWTIPCMYVHVYVYVRM